MSTSGDWWQGPDGNRYPPEQRGLPLADQSKPAIGNRLRFEDRWVTALPPGETKRRC